MLYGPSLVSQKNSNPKDRSQDKIKFLLKQKAAIKIGI